MGYYQTVNCKFCGDATRAWVTKSNRLYSCSYACRMALKNKQKRPNKKALKKWKKDSFYSSPEWLAIRYSILREADGKCCLCSRGRQDRIALHVDHIKPISKFPHLKLERSNLQILCGECNIGKGNSDSIDWRKSDRV